LTAQPILAATDFSEDSRAAILWACRYAECTNAPLIILHVVHDLASHPGFYLSKKTDPLQSMQDVAENMMAEFLDKLKAEHPGLNLLATADVRLVPGLPASRIIEVAGLLKAGMIAIGGRGIDCSPHSTLGSVAERVIKLSSIPAVVIKSGELRVLKKKERKRREKLQNKDRKKLRTLLGLTDKAQDKGHDLG